MIRRVLVLDEAIAEGGVRRMWDSLAPELAIRCEFLLWVLPQHRLPDYISAHFGKMSIRFETIEERQWGARRLAGALVNRVSRWKATYVRGRATRLQQQLHRRRIAALVRQYQITHIIIPALFTQRSLDTTVPVIAAVMDTNYAESWREECMHNLTHWAASGAKLVSISDFTRAEAEKHCPIRTQAITAIPLASEMPDESLSYGKREREAVTRIYYPASFHTHKGHACLLAAIHQLRSERMAVRLVLSGGSLSLLTNEQPLDCPKLENARRLLMQSGSEFQRAVEIRGFLAPVEVEEMYRHADLVVFPSEYEGFGLPLAEAVARGKRVIASDLPPLREQVERYGFGEAVTLVAEHSPASWADAIRQAVLTPKPFPFAPDQLKEVFERWTWGAVADAWTTVLDSTQPPDRKFYVND